MTQIVINACHGGFGLSDEAIVYYANIANKNLIAEPSKHYRFSGTDWYEDSVDPQNYFWCGGISRDCPYLVRTVLDLGDIANTSYSKLKVVTIPDDVSWHIAEYDGMEWVAENHRTWQ